ncbi:sulfotransferase domain-containing protein [Ancylobacter lacus]|uniref:sulfotransferase domain-containing protein n=1 Tax=Ancylobacter lacus TaxID=2579970 RepID=UPI001BD14CEA|nr:sulfotransferase domain-containing protein [Ancylobacter lacus]MBS7538157.1 sulfotransferase domain-containing protein [Ancylobacter lacus]
MTGLVLIASYPKSGNTWMRAFLASLTLGGRTPDLHGDMEAIPTLAARGLQDAFAGLECSDLTPAEVARLRPYVSRRIAAARPGLYKVHDANLAPPGAAEPAIPAETIDRVVYVVRDPRDVALSAAHHFGQTVEAVVADLGDEAHMIGRSAAGLNANVEQWLSSWSRHVESWLDAPGLRRLCVRYEDLTARPEETFAQVCRFLELEATVADIAGAIAATRFERLAAREQEDGFPGALTVSGKAFFRKGRAGGWREALAPALAESIARDHAATMARFGYR